MDKKKSVALRIKEVREDTKLASKDFAASVKVDSSQYSKIEQGKLAPTINLIMELNSIYGISIDWLLTGTGSMLKQNVISGIDADNMLVSTGKGMDNKGINQEESIIYKMYQSEKEEVNRLMKQIGKLEYRIEQLEEVKSTLEKELDACEQRILDSRRESSGNVPTAPSLPGGYIPTRKERPGMGAEGK
jgi:transcriptional regulator with XRE-family HTH domain